MAIKIISETPPPQVLKQTVCGKCGCTLEYAPIDLKVGSSADYTGDTDAYKYINCPKCGNEILIGW